MRVEKKDNHSVGSSCSKDRVDMAGASLAVDYRVSLYEKIGSNHVLSAEQEYRSESCCQDCSCWFSGCEACCENVCFVRVRV